MTPNKGKSAPPNEPSVGGDEAREREERARRLREQIEALKDPAKRPPPETPRELVEEERAKHGRRGGSSKP